MWKLVLVKKAHRTAGGVMKVDGREERLKKIRKKSNEKQTSEMLGIIR